MAVKAIEDVKELVHPFLKKKKKLKKKKSEIPDEMEKKTGSEELSIEEISEAISFSESLEYHFSHYLFIYFLFFKFIISLLIGFFFLLFWE